MLQCAFADAHGVIVHAEDERSNRVHVALGEALEHCGILAGLVEPFVDIFEIGGINGLHADEDPLATRRGDQINEFFVAQQVGADLRHPIDLSFRGDDVSQQRFGALHVDGEVVVNEEDSDLALFFSRARLQKKQLVDYAFVAAKANGVAEESGDGAELAAVGTTPSGFDRNDSECSPTFADLLEQREHGLGNEIELMEVNRVPGDHGIRLQRRLALFACFVYGFVKVFEFAARGIVHNLRPSLVGFSEGNGVGVPRATVAAESFCEFFGHVRPAHNDGHSNRANGVGHAVGFGDHSRHGADADQSNVLFADELRNLRFVHALGIAVNQNYFVSWGSERLQEEHPQVRHEIAGNTVVWVIEQNSHECPLSYVLHRTENITSDAVNRALAYGLA